MTQITWLHFSDLHICPPRDGWDARKNMEQLLDQIHELNAQQGIRPDLIFFTGDAAFGQIGNKQGENIADQFEIFGNFLSSLCNVFSPPIPFRDVFLVPGNHDVDRSRIYEETTYLDSAREDEPERIFETGGRRLSIYMDRLEPYSEFLRKQNLDHLLQDPERLIYTHTRNLAGTTIGIAGFNTAWLSGRSGKNAIRTAGLLQLNRLWDHVKDASLRIALLHHPSNWLHPSEDPKLGRELRQLFDFILHGHEHEHFIETSDNSATVISVGASFHKSNRRNFNLVQFDPDSGNGEVITHSWDAQNTQVGRRTIQRRAARPAEPQLLTVDVSTSDEAFEEIRSIVNSFKKLNHDQEKDFNDF